MRRLDARHDDWMKTPVSRGLALGLSLALSACGGDKGGGDSGFDEGLDSGIDSGLDSGLTESSDASSDEGSSDGPRLDTPDDSTGSGSGSEGGSDECQKVDLLFVIDNSGSMAGEQASLVASFGGFVAGIQAALAQAESYHVGVVTTDSYDNNGSGCTSIGDLVTQTGGENAAGMDCLPFSSGKRYLDESEPDLASKFACIAQVGTTGSGDELQVQSGWEALAPAKNAPGACNDGFLRDDALLVVVIITDENDAEQCIPIIGCMGGSPGDPVDWFNTYSGYKAGIQENIVVLALTGLPGNSCGVDEGSRLVQFTNWFSNGSVGDICAPSYETFFNEAISVIDTACSNFTPPG